MVGRIGFYPGGPAGGASAGGDYGGNVNPEQEYAGRTFQETYGGGNNTTTTNINTTGDGANVSVKKPVIEKGFNWKNIFWGGKPFYGPITNTGAVDEDDAAVIPTSGYEGLAGDLGKQRVAEKAGADIWKEFNTGGRVGAQEGGLMDLGGMEKDYRKRWRLCAYRWQRKSR